MTGRWSVRPVAALRRVGALHAALAQSLVLWLLRRRDGVPPGATALPYGRETRVLAAALLAVSLVEVAVVELAVPWPRVRSVLFVVGVVGVLLVLSWFADLVVRPHVLTADTLRLRAGSYADVTLPLGAVESVGRRTAPATRAAVVLSDGVLVLAVGNETQLELRLREPVRVRAGGRAGSVTSVRVESDDPAAAAASVTAARDRLTGSGPPTPGR